jgi:hypothetical protein
VSRIREKPTYANDERRDIGSSPHPDQIHVRRWTRGLLRRRARDHLAVLCAMTGLPHSLFWMRSAWWCQDCRQKVEGCCEGGGCPSVAEVLPVVENAPRK